MLSIAVVTGFKSEIKRKIMGFDSQVTVMPLEQYYGYGDATLEWNDSLQQIIRPLLSEASANGNVEIALTATQPGIIKTPDDFAGVLFRGYDDCHKWTFEKTVLVDGVLPDNSDTRGITISKYVASKLCLKVGDTVDAYFIIDGQVRPRRFDIKGVYCSNFSDYDNTVAFAPMTLLSKLNKYADDEGGQLVISGLNEEEITPVATELQNRLSVAYATGKLSKSMAVTTVFSTGAVYFNWLDLLNTNVVVILILMGCVSGFTLILCVLILILQRVKMVGILKAMGANNRLIRNVFIRLGIRVTGLGLIIGNVLSGVVIWAESTFRLLPLDPDSYYLSYVPMTTSVTDWLLLNVGVVAVSFAIMLIPTAIISRLSPVKPLRFE
jgi:lipoprotein-releasing system permease protein